MENWPNKLHNFIPASGRSFIRNPSQSRYLTGFHPKADACCVYSPRSWNWYSTSPFHPRDSHQNRVTGGAERLVVDAALGLQALGHSVDLYTSYHDPQHCFDETKDGVWLTSELSVFSLIFRNFEGTPRRSTISSLFKRKISYFIRSFASTSFDGAYAVSRRPDL